MPDCQKDTNVPYCAYVVNFSHDNTTTKMPNPQKPKPARVFHFDLHGNAKKKEGDSPRWRERRECVRHHAGGEHQYYC